MKAQSNKPSLMEKIYWSNHLDNEYRCYVLEQTDTYGYLRMERIDDGARVLDVEVPISRYFREQDIVRWGDMCIYTAYNLRKKKDA